MRCIEKGGTDALQCLGQILPTVAVVQFQPVGHVGGLQVGVGPRGIFGVEFKGDDTPLAAGIDQRLDEDDGGAAFLAGLFDGGNTMFEHGELRVGQQSAVVPNMRW